MLDVLSRDGEFPRDLTSSQGATVRLARNAYIPVARAEISSELDLTFLIFGQQVWVRESLALVRRVNY
jgi:hypothetical protein